MHVPNAQATHHRFVRLPHLVGRFAREWRDDELASADAVSQRPEDDLLIFLILVSANDEKRSLRANSWIARPHRLIVEMLNFSFEVRRRHRCTDCDRYS